MATRSDCYRSSETRVVCQADARTKEFQEWNVRNQRSENRRRTRETARRLCRICVLKFACRLGLDLRDRLAAIAPRALRRPNQQAWNWLLPMLLPTLGLVTGARLAVLDRQCSPGKARRIVFRIALWLSIFYLAVILLTILVQPMAGTSPAAWLDLMRRSSLLLSPLQGLAASSVGVLFVSREPSPAFRRLRRHPRER